VNGASYSGVVKVEEPAYFNITTTDSGPAALTLSPLSGSPAVYAACGSGGELPSAEVNKWQLHLDGGSGATLTVTGERACVCLSL
jgi:hypothetical protein